MNEKDLITLDCTACGAKLYAEKELKYWYCGHCGEKLELPKSDSVHDKKPVPVKVKKHSEDKSLPTGELAAPVEEKSATVEESSAPVEEEPATVEKSSAPAEVVSAPAKEEAVPVKEETAQEEDKPEFEIDLVELKSYNGKASELELPGSIRKIGNGAFKGNTTLTSLTIPDSVTEIGSSAFEGCTELESVRLPGGLKKINYKTFNNCDKLRKIVIPASVEEISFNAMCCGLQEIEFESSKTHWDPNSADTDPSFNVDRKGNGSGVSRIVFKGVTYDAAELFRHKSVAAYLRSQGLCPRCGNQYNLLKKCKGCGTKKGY